jgi:hypothetical protein
MYLTNGGLAYTYVNQHANDYNNAYNNQYADDYNDSYDDQYADDYKDRYDNQHADASCYAGHFANRDCHHGYSNRASHDWS